MNACTGKKEYALNKLQYFRVNSGLPPDIAHYLLEGIVPYEIVLCLNIFIEQKYKQYVKILAKK